ncbi:MAG: hypothetical protein AAGH43_10410 [Pseudomonadota bacterium]
MERGTGGAFSGSSKAMAESRTFWLIPSSSDRTKACNVLPLRLSTDNQAACWETHGGEPVTQYGSVMRGYVALSDAVLDDAGLFAKWFAQCLDDAEALPTKPTKKKR